MSVRVSGMEGAYHAGLGDVIIIPLVAVALALKAFLRAVILILMRILDFSFPLLMQLIRLPLFTLRVAGDGIIAAVVRVLALLPFADENRRRWSQLIRQKWSVLRSHISYKAFEHAVHRAFERGMEWVFATCRTLSPRRAFYVIVAAVLWLPISLGLATAIHALLLVYAAWLPAWMQLLHPLATVIAKSKLLVLPVYPAAWPHAKRHPMVQAIGSGFRSFAGLYLVQKVGWRYQQAEQARDNIIAGFGRMLTRLGLRSLYDGASGKIDAIRRQTGNFWSQALRFAFVHLSPVPLIGPVLKQYASHYDNVQRHPGKTSARLTGVWERWSVRFTAEYYEAKAKEKAASLEQSAHVIPGVGPRIPVLAPEHGVDGRDKLP